MAVAFHVVARQGSSVAPRTLFVSKRVRRRSVGNSVVKSEGLTIGLNENAYLRKPSASQRFPTETVSHPAKPPFRSALT